MLLLAVIGASAAQFAPPRRHSPATVSPSTVWPAPAAATPGNTMLWIRPGGQFEVVAATGQGSELLEDAMARLRNTTFAWGAPQQPRECGPPPPATLQLRRLVVQVDAQGEPGYPSSTMDESYTLTIAAPSATLRSAEVWGAIRGLQTFSQLVAHNYSDSCHYHASGLTVKDAPRYPHRAVMIDTARRFYPVATILAVLAGMEAAKLNVLHWHATDNEAFPLVLPSHPELAAAGAWTATGHSYSVAEIKRVVSEARRRAIRVVVELDTPGHVGGLCRSHGTCVPRGYTGMGCLLDPSLPLTWQLLNDTFGDLCDLFPDDLVMIGGDEVTASVWERE